ncbi:MAG: CHAD domain-containing protein [Anaerolineae bacterium]|nr:CHAD domain-containing protein [Thermoflexales bacterium]MDW8407066.1 CHAD domain-containing protein [Anaerolineae bacterium]
MRKIPVVSTIHNEIEWQFESERPGEAQDYLVALVRAHGLKAGKRRTETHRDTYLDTGDWRFYRAGYALRVRQAAQGNRSHVELTLKSLDGAQGALRHRREITERVELRQGEDLARLVCAAPGPVGERVRAVSGCAPIGALFEIVTRRTTVALHRGNTLMAEVALDQSTISAPAGQMPVALQRIEIEATAEAQDELQTFIDAWLETYPMGVPTQSKFEAGLTAQGLLPVKAADLVAAPLSLTGRSLSRLALGELALAMVRKRVADLLECEPGARLGEDIEALHSMRVATRRLRALLRLFQDALPEHGTIIRSELRWLAGVLGETRDLDVHLEQTRAWASEAGAEERAALDTLAQLLEQDRLVARRAMLTTLDSARYERLKVSLIALCGRSLSELPPQAVKPAEQAMPKLLSRRYRRLHELADVLTDESPPADFHAARIQGKRLRYALEAAAPLYGKPARALIKRLAEMQDVLGRYQDAQVAVTRVNELCAKHSGDLPADTVAALNRIAQRYAQHGEEIRQEFWPAWRALRRAWDKFSTNLSS